MNLNEIFKNNVLFLQQQLRLKNAQIATIASTKGYALTKAYVGKLLKPSVMTNVSLEKVSAFSTVFNQRPIDMLNPLGFNENGSPKGTEHLLNVDVLTESIMEVETLMEESELVDAQFRAQAVTLVYDHKMQNNKSQSSLRSVLSALLENQTK